MREQPGDDRQMSMLGWLALGCLFACGIGFLMPSAPSAQAPVVKAHAKREPSPTPTPASETMEERRVTFASTMPRYNGTQVYNNNGLPNPNQVMVAIPDGPKSVRFVRGDDPAALHHLAQTSAEQKRTIFDAGPSQIDTSNVVDLGPLKGRESRSVRNLSADDGPPAQPAAPPAAQ